VSRRPFKLAVFVAAAVLPSVGGCGGTDVDRFRIGVTSAPRQDVIGSTTGGKPGSAVKDSGPPMSDARAGAFGQGGAPASGVDASGASGGSIPGAGGAARSDASPGTDGASSSAGGSPTGAGGRDASSSPDGASSSPDGGSSQVGSGLAEWFVAFDSDPGGMDIAVDRATNATYVSVNPQYGGLFLVKIRSDGSVAWRKNFPGAGAIYAPLVVDPDGNIVIASGYSDATVLGLDGGVSSGGGAFVAKYTSDGALIFARMFPGGPPYVNSSAVTPDGRILVAGEMYNSSIDFGSGPIPGGFVVSLTPNGKHEWSRGSDNARVKSVASDPQGNAIITGRGTYTVNLGGVPHIASTQNGSGDYLIARFAPNGDEVDFQFIGDPNLDEYDIYGSTDRTGNLYLRGRFPRRIAGNQPLPVSFGDGPALAEWLPYFISLTGDGKYRYGFSLPGSNGNWINDHAVANDGAAWYAGSQQLGLAIEGLFTPDPGSSGRGLLFRASPDGTVDELRAFQGGSLQAVDADARGRPVVGGFFPGGVDFGGGLIGPTHPAAIVARLNLGPGASTGMDGSMGGTGGASGRDAGGGSGGVITGDAGAPAGPVEFATTFDGDISAAVDVAADRVSEGTYVSINGTLFKLRPNGTIAWQKSFPSAGSWSMPVVADADGNVIVASGYSDGTVLGLPADAGVASGSGLLVAKYTPGGTPIFAKTWPGGPAFLGSSAVTPDGRILVVGEMNSGSFDFGDGPITGQGVSFLLSLRANGDFEWSRGSANTFLRSAASDPQGGAIVVGMGSQAVDFGGFTHSMGSNEFLFARFSPSGIETDFRTYGGVGTEVFGTTDRAGNLFFWGNYSPMQLSNPPQPFAIGDGPGLALGYPYLLSFTASGSYRYGSSLVGDMSGTWVLDLAIHNDGTAWYVGGQTGALAIGKLLSPAPGGGLLFRQSRSGIVDLARSYPGGEFNAVDVDERGRPIVAGKFYGGVDFGAGTIPMGNPSTVVAKLNL
jgi:hypothetical protein